MRGRHLYEVWLKIEDREDVDDDWNITYQLKFTTNKQDKAWDYIYTHRYLETDLDTYDNGEHCLRIQTLIFKRIY